MASTKANAPKISTRPLPDFTANPEFWPVLPALEAWQDTRDTVHMWTQIVGKVRLALNPLINHWWEVPLYVSPRGLATSSIPYARGIFEVEFDFLADRDRKSTRLNSSHANISYAVFCLKKKNKTITHCHYILPLVLTPGSTDAARDAHHALAYGRHQDGVQGHDVRRERSSIA